MKIKIILSLVCSFIISLNSLSQNNTFGDIIIGVSKPEIPKEVAVSHQDKIKNKIIRAINKHSLSAVSKNSEFTVHTVFKIHDEEALNGLRNQTVINSELYLRIEQKSTKTIFSTYSKIINGIGSNREKALNNAIKKIAFDEAKFKAFIDKGKEEITTFFNNNCNRLISNIEAAYNNGEYKKAIILSASIPNEAESCFTKAKKITAKSYLAYRNTFCKELILAAKSALSQDNFKLAGKYLSHIDPQSQCYPEANSLLKEIQTEHGEHVQQYIEQEYNLEVLRIFAITEILTQHYGNINSTNNNSNNTHSFNNISSTGPNVFLIAVADTQDEKIGKSTQQDLKSITNLFRRASKELGIGYAEKQLYANTFDKAHIINTMNSLPVKNNDVLIFYYSGHGNNDPKTGSLFPMMNLDGDDLLLEELHKSNKTKNARLTITIGDLCNSLPASKIIIETKKEFVHKSSYLFDKEKLGKLLLHSSGDVISTSSRKGQYSFCSNNNDGSMGNGQFTNAFLNEFTDATTRNVKRSSPTNWNSIFKNAYQQALSATIKRKNQDGEYGQLGFNIINIK